MPDIIDDIIWELTKPVETVASKEAQASVLELQKKIYKRKQTFRELENEALNNLKLIHEDEFWRVFEERGTSRIWARRKEALNLFTLPCEEPKEKKKKNYKL